MNRYLKVERHASETHREEVCSLRESQPSKSARKRSICHYASREPHPRWSVIMRHSGDGDEAERQDYRRRRHPFGSDLLLARGPKLLARAPKLRPSLHLCHLSLHLPAFSVRRCALDDRRSDIALPWHRRGARRVAFASMT